MPVEFILTKLLFKSLLLVIQFEVCS